jgi:hypothetical protein
VLADEQPLADLGVRVAVAGESRDLGFLGGEFVPGLDAASPGVLGGGQQLAFGAYGERLDPHRVEHLECGAQFLSRVDAPSLSAQPLAVEEMGARELNANARAPEPVDRLAIEAVCLVALGEERGNAPRSRGQSLCRSPGSPL